ncbi:hypothetical protein M5D96_011976 [Drosophila gunungcola]|uniref:Uncharacterized protein n=1 Tax=Drosophila gunungcola TaxID=103775 RepID=A0A9Q0BJX3_9MUSC|nr:hypothetical protein M5D96_011976 [Drosophila gunungcola]
MKMSEFTRLCNAQQDIHTQFLKRAMVPVYVEVVLWQRSSSNALWYCKQNLQRAL